MRRSGLLLSVLAAMLAFGITHPVQAAGLVGKAAPEISVQDWLNSPPLTLAALRGKIVVVEFWATWCPPCRKSIPHLIELYKKYGGQGVVILGLTDEPKAKVEPFAKEMGMIYPVGCGSKSSGAYGVTGIPHAAIVDTAGNVVWDGHPMQPDFESTLEAQLKKTPPKVASQSKGPSPLEDISASMQKAQFGRAAALLAKFQAPEGNTAAKNQVERIRKALLAQAPARLAQGEKSLAAKEYYKASEAFQDVTLMAPDSPQAKKAEERLKELQADEKIKAEVEQGREKAADDLLTDILKREKAGPAATVKALEDLAERFPNTKAGAAAAEKAKALSTSQAGGKAD
jgi:cytochrome c biogenesis protein CcmG/thiol:disulfide interchange protein DsbE